MADMWSGWQSEVERLTPFAEEWNEGRVEDFIRNLLNCAARKRDQRGRLLQLMEEVRELHSRCGRMLAFFDLERACQAWSAETCGASEVERVLEALTEWRAHLLKHSENFPLSEDDTRTFAALRDRMREAEAAAETIRPCFSILDAALSAARGEPEAANAAAE